MSVSKRLRFEIFRRDNHACRYCGATASDTPLTIDHVMPTALGGTNDPSNLVTACQDCNAGKTSSIPATLYVADVAEDALERARARRLEERPTDLADQLLGHLDIESDEQVHELATITRIGYEEDDEQPALSTVEWAVLGAVSNVVDKASVLEYAIQSLLRQLPGGVLEDLRRDCTAELTAYVGNEWSDNDLTHWMIRRLRVVGTREPDDARVRSSSDPWAVN